jgi:hypothetical protein
MITGYLFNGTT